MVLLKKMTVSSNGNIRLRCAMKLLGCAKIFGVLGCLGYVSAGVCRPAPEGEGGYLVSFLVFSVAWSRYRYRYYL